MANNELNLFIDQEGGNLVAGFASTQLAQPLTFVFGDAAPINVRVLSDGTSRIWDDADLTNKNIRASIGTPNGQPTGGTFNITYGANTTTDLAYNATASEVETALNLLASITAAGGVTVTKTALGPYKITFGNVGARTDISTDNSALYPTTTSNALEAITGDASTREVVLLKLEAQPAAYIELTTALPVSAATVNSVREGATGISDIQTFELDPTPYDGSYAITIAGEKTGAIPWDADAEDIKASVEALTSIGAGNCIVTGLFPFFTLTFATSLADVGEMTLDVSSLIVPTGRTGSLDINTTGIVELLDGAASTTATFELEIYDTITSTSYTPVQTTCTIKEDVSGNTPASQTPLPVYLTDTSVLNGDKIDITGTTDIGADLVDADEILVEDNGTATVKKSAMSRVWTFIKAKIETIALSAIEVTGNITVGGTVDGRDVATDGTKLDGVEALADVTDAINVGSSMAGATAKVTPVDADTIPLNDSADSDLLKKVTLTNLWVNYLKPLADALYVTLTGNHTVSGDLTLTGASTIVDQDTSDATSIVNVGMLRDYADNFSHRIPIVWLQADNYTAGGGSVVGKSRGYWQLFADNVANSYAGSWVDLQGIGSNSALDFGRRIVTKSTFFDAASDPDFTFVFQIGRAITTVTPAILATDKGFGYKNINAVCTPFLCDGTTLTNGATFSDVGVQAVVQDWTPGLSLKTYTLSTQGVLTLVDTITTGLPTGAASGSRQLECFLFETSGASPGGTGRVYVNDTSFAQY